jgi:hypothetical protein
LAVLAIAAPVAWNSRKTYRKVNQLLDRIQGDIAPIVKHAHAISENVEYVTTSIRRDVHLINTTIATANDRVQDAVGLTEARLNEFNALLQVVQEEAEGLFLSTASAVRGVRTGAAEFGRRGGPDLASDELDAADPADELERHLESEEEGHGHDSDSDPVADALTGAPRIRPRTRSHRRGA